MGDPQKWAAQALLGMNAAANVRDVALAARRILLSDGWGVDHAACRELDQTAQHYGYMHEGFRRQLIDARAALAAVGEQAPSPGATGG